MAGSPKDLTENPNRTTAQDAAAHNAAMRDVLSDVLRCIRLSGSLQFCFMPAGDWETDDAPALASLGDGTVTVIPFHIVAEGRCWMRLGGREIALETGDVVAFPFSSGHQLGGGHGGRRVAPVRDLPPKPWRAMPVLRYGDGETRLRMLCGYLQCEAMNFQPLRKAMPELLHARTAAAGDSGWLRATIRQIIAEADHPSSGSNSMLERLTEILFIELLRHEIVAAPPGTTGWLAALADPALSRCLTLIHEDPLRDWTVPMLAGICGLSRSSLAERFETMLQTSPMRYVRDWRLCQASVALSTTSKPVAAVAYDAGYGTEAAFNRAFARAYGLPPAAWRQTARRGLSA